MPLLSRLRTLLAKIESSYGVDPTPTGSANAILVRGLDIRPVVTDFQPRELVRPFLGNFENLPNDTAVEVTFETELIGNAVAGTAAPIGPLLRGCALSQTLLGTAHTGTAQAGAATTITLAAGASAVDDAYTGLLIRLTGGTGAGQQRIITDYVGSTKVATIADPWAVNPVGASTTYSIDAQAAHSPVSSAFESVCIYFNVNGVRHKVTGARGSVSFGLDNKGIPVGRFRFLGIYNAVADASEGAVDYSGFQTPVTVGNTNTTPFLLHGYAGRAASLSVDMANELVFRSLIGGIKEVIVVDRKVAGQSMLEAVTVATKDYFASVQAGTLGAFMVTQGLVTAKKATIAGNRTQIIDPAYQDQDGVQMLQSGQLWIPSTAGNDEFSLIFH